MGVKNADVAELVYARALGARSERIVGSSPTVGTASVLQRFLYMLHLELLSQHKNLSVIDLHKFKNSYEALEFLELELYRLYKNGEQYIRIVHGVGEGILKGKVHDALSKNPLVKEFRLEEHGGSTIVVLNII